MNFPETHHTLIQRLVTGRDEADWRQFLGDYWRPVCRFALRSGAGNLDDAEDIASATFMAILTGDLLARWHSDRRARLRTLLCSVTRNLLFGRWRLENRRTRRLRENRDLLKDAAAVHLESEPSVPAQQMDVFYGAWVEELLQDAADQLLNESLKAGRADRFRVLFGRICEQMTHREIGEMLSLPLSAVENDYRFAKKRLGELLEKLVKERVSRYTSSADPLSEFQGEWEEIGRYLECNGGIEDALRKAHLALDASDHRRREHAATTMLLNCVAQQDRPKA